MEKFHCPYLSAYVELSNERERHIGENHPDLFPEYKEEIVEVIGKPDRVRISERIKSARLFSRWFDNKRGGKHIVVVVMTDIQPRKRHWIATAYITRRLSQGVKQNGRQINL